LKQENDMAEEKQKTEQTKQATENAKKTVAEGKEARSLQDAQRAAMAKGKPTPTQEENDIAVSGGYPDLEDDGSGPDVQLTLQPKQVEAGKPSGGYQTRQATPARAKE